jgi:membrane protease YdiL (CAAX protease family)
MRLGASLLCFGIPALLVVFFTYVVMPALRRAGFTPYMSYTVGLTIPLAILLLASLAAYRLEGNPLTWAAFRFRFRLHPIAAGDWVWIVGTLVATFVAYYALVGMTRTLLAAGIVPLPASLPPMLDPRLSISPETAPVIFGETVAGNWSLVPSLFVLLFFNIFGEEFWWRGYILPRQELVWGKYTWLVHGLLWTLFHAFKWWDLPALLPVCLGLSFMAQRRRNTWPVVITHYIFNGISLLGIIALVAGAG